MEPRNIPLNPLIVGLTNSGNSRFVVDQLYGPFRDKFDYIVLICPTLSDDCAASKDVKVGPASC